MDFDFFGDVFFDRGNMCVDPTPTADNEEAPLPRIINAEVSAPPDRGMIYYG